MSLSATTAPPSPAAPPARPPARHAPAAAICSTASTSRYSPYLYIAPFFVIFGIFGLYPMVRTAWMSLHDWDLHRRPHRSSGFDNYTRLITDEYFWNALVNTFGIFVLSTVPQLLLALFLANLLNRPAARARPSSGWPSSCPT